MLKQYYALEIFCRTLNFINIKLEYAKLLAICISYLVVAGKDSCWPGRAVVDIPGEGAGTLRAQGEVGTPLGQEGLRGP